MSESSPKCLVPRAVTASGNSALSPCLPLRCSICGPLGVTKEALRSPIAPGQNGPNTLVLLPATGIAVRDLAASFDKDLGTRGGLDVANLKAPPTVRVMASLFGMPGMTAVGFGFAQQIGTSTTYTINSSYSLSAAEAMKSLGPKFWVSTEATDMAGNIARHRRIIGDNALGTTFPSGATPGVPTITAQGGAITGSPVLTFQDRLDPASVTGGFGFHVVTATSAGRNWRLIRQDIDGLTGGTVLQFPDFAGVNPVGLVPGSWAIRAESHLVFSLTFGNGDFMLEEMRREEVTYSRAADETFVVN